MAAQNERSFPRTSAGPGHLPAHEKTDPQRGKLRPSGGYRTTCSFQTATLVYDATYRFCDKFLDPRSRTVDQMIQAARSGRQNIAEGSRASATSSQTELRLINVARASLEELLLDYEDFLRHRGHRLWAPDAPEALAVRRLSEKARADRTDRSDEADRERWRLYSPWLEHKDPAVRANAVICLIHQTNFLLDRQISALEKDFIMEGGYSEVLAAARLGERQRRGRDRSDRTDRSDGTGQARSGEASHPTGDIPSCPDCGQAMVLRTAKTGGNKGNSFWGCSAYPKCKGIVRV
jgi:restriction system protein